MAAEKDLLDSLANLFSVGLHSPIVSDNDIRSLVTQEREKRLQAIRVLNTELTRINLFHNILSVVNSIPPELLRRVFSYLPSKSNLNVDLLAVTHVCKHWRSIALEDPSLWTDFPIHHLESVKMYLGRSETMPISVCLTKTLSRIAVKHFKTAVHRMRSLYVSMPDEYDIIALLARLKCPAPLLETLFIERCHKYRDGRRVTDNMTSRMPPGLFKGAVPSLRSLTLHNVSIPSFLCPSLEHLDVSVTARLPNIPVSVLFNILACCPLLKTVILRGQFSNNDFDFAGDPVELSHLEYLSLFIGPGAAVARLLSLLIIPEKTNIRISISSMLHGSETLESMMLPLHGHHSARPPLRSVVGVQNLLLSWSWSEGYWTLNAYRDADDVLHIQTPALSIKCMDVTGELVPSILRSWPFDTCHVRTLVLSSSYDDSVAPHMHWLTALRSLPELRTLRVIGLAPYETIGLVTALAHREPEMLCPRLETLEFIDVDFGNRELHTTLLETLALRVAGEEQVLKRLELSACRIKLSDVAAKCQFTERGFEIDMGDE